MFAETAVIATVQLNGSCFVLTAAAAIAVVVIPCLSFVVVTVAGVAIISIVSGAIAATVVNIVCS